MGERDEARCADRDGGHSREGSGTGGGSQPDVDPGDGRDESLNERMDRNWNEILQELRVTQTGTQILTGFLLTIAFQQTFAHLTVFQRRLYLVLVVTAVLTTALGLAPVNLHRGLFRRHAKAVIVGVAHLILRLTLIGVALVLAGTMLLIFDVVVGRSAAYAALAATVVALGAVGALPLIIGGERRRREIPPDGGSSEANGG